MVTGTWLLAACCAAFIKVSAGLSYQNHRILTLRRRAREAFRVCDFRIFRNADQPIDTLLFTGFRRNPGPGRLDNKAQPILDLPDCLRPTYGWWCPVLSS